MAGPHREPGPARKADPRHIPRRRPFNGALQGDKLLTNEGVASPSAQATPCA